MAIMASKQKKFAPAPEGLWPGVCCDVVDKGLVPTPWGAKHKVQLRWLVDAAPRREDGKPHMISMSYTLSLHEDANLRKMLEVWRGKKFTEDELQGFDLEKLIGVHCQIQVASDKGKDGDTYSFPQVVLKAQVNQGKTVIPADYIRQAERDRRGKLQAEPDGPSAVDDDDPFGGALPQQTEDESLPF